MLHPPVKFGFGLMKLPVGVLVANSLEDQIDLLFFVADDPNTKKFESLELLHLANRLMKKMK